MYLITLSRLRPENDLLHQVNCPSQKPLLLIKRRRLKEIRTTSLKSILCLTTPFYQCVSCPRKKQTNKQTNKKTANKQTKKQPNPNQIKKTNNTEKHTLLGADSAEILSGKSSQGEVIFAA